MKQIKYPKFIYIIGFLVLASVIFLSVIGLIHLSEEGFVDLLISGLFTIILSVILSEAKPQDIVLFAVY